jgi:hypothetical protein
LSLVAWICLICAVPGDVLLFNTFSRRHRTSVERLLLRSRAGYYWQAIRESEDAAAASALIVPVKMLAVIISGNDRFGRYVFSILL